MTNIHAMTINFSKRGDGTWRVEFMAYDRDGCHRITKSWTEDETYDALAFVRRYIAKPADGRGHPGGSTRPDERITEADA